MHNQHWYVFTQEDVFLKLKVNVTSLTDLDVANWNTDSAGITSVVLGNISVVRTRYNI